MTIKTQTLRVLVLIALLFGLQSHFSVAHAAGIVVNSLLDTIIAGDGNCTLREAITNANANADTTGGNCALGSGADIITFSVSGTITLGSTLPILTDTAGLTIDGTGQTVTISGNNSVRVLRINAGVPLALNHVTIANGSSDTGGGVYSDTATLSVTNSTFSHNSANFTGGGGIYAPGSSVTIANTTFTNNSAPNGADGGGIFTDNGTLTVTNSSFILNTGYDGAGIVSFNSTVTITNSTFSGNSADNTGGGITSCCNANAVLTITNSTLSGNSASEFLGGGVRASGGSATLYNTIIANSTSGGNCSGLAITNGGNNIEDGTSCKWGFTNGSWSGTNPMLGPLADNGGPTETFALIPGSPAIEGVTFSPPNHAPSTDQRGVARPQGVKDDIGSFEYPGPTFYWIHLPILLR